MAFFKLEDYETVEERIKRFYSDHPSGAIHTELASSPDEMPKWVAFKALVRKDAASSFYDATGYAMEIQGQGNVNKDAHVENCETSAIGRALANLNYSGSKRPSREEMSKVSSAASLSSDALARNEARAEKREAAPAQSSNIGTMLSLFASRGVKKVDIEEYLDHEVSDSAMTEGDLAKLRTVWSKIMSGTRPDSFFPHWFADDIPPEVAMVERVLGATAKLDKATEPLSP